MKILIRNSKEKVWKIVESAEYGKETELQKLLAESPGLISLEEIRPRAGTLVWAVQEFGLPIGSVDLIAFTAGGDIAVIECKLATNQEVKRKVIGQVLDYGANLWEMRYEELDEAVHMRTGENLAELIKKKVEGPGWDEEHFRNKVSSSLESGNFMLLIVVDEINEDLARIVRFINVCGTPSFEFAAMEMQRYQAQNAEMLVPRVFGPVRSANSKANSVPVDQWDESSFFEELVRRQGKDTARAARRILEWANNNSQVWWGKGKRTGSFVPTLAHKEKSHQLFAVYTYGNLEIYFYWYAYKPPFNTEEKRLDLLNRLNQIEGIQIPKEAIARRPSIKLEALAKYNTVEEFLDVFDWVVKEIKNT